MRSSGGREQREHRGEGGLLGTWLGVSLGGWVWELPPSSPARVVDPHGVVQQSHGEFAGVWMPGEGTDAAAGPAGGRGHREQPGPTSAIPSSNSQSHHQNKSQLSLLSKVASSANFPSSWLFLTGCSTNSHRSPLHQALVQFNAVPPTCTTQHQGTKQPQAMGNYSPQHPCAGEAEHRTEG